MELKEALVTLFTDDPVNWLKWAVVFAVLIGGYCVAIPIYGKVSYFLSRERKRDMARGRGHVIESTIVDQFKHDIDDWSARYAYTLDGEERQYSARFRGQPPRLLYLYYIDSPRKVFAVDDVTWEAPKGLVLLPIVALPWLLAALALVVLKVDISGIG